MKDIRLWAATIKLLSLARIALKKILAFVDAASVRNNRLHFDSSPFHFCEKISNVVSLSKELSTTTQSWYIDCLRFLSVAVKIPLIGFSYETIEFTLEPRPQYTLPINVLHCSEKIFSTVDVDCWQNSEPCISSQASWWHFKWLWKTKLSDIDPRNVALALIAVPVVEAEALVLNPKTWFFYTKIFYVS